MDATKGYPATDKDLLEAKGFAHMATIGPEGEEPDPDKTLIHKLAKKYLGKDGYPYDGPDDHRVIFRVIPSRIYGHG